MFEERTYELFSARISKGLPVFDPTCNLEKTETSKTIENIVKSARSCAPYLDILCASWPNILEALHQSPPEQIFDDLKENIDTSSYETLCKTLREAKQQLHLLTALCDLSGRMVLGAKSRKC